MTIMTMTMKDNVRHPLNLLLVFILPSVLLIIPSTSGGFPFGLTLFGMANMYCAFLLTRPIATDRMQNIIIRIASSPLRYFRYLFEHLASYMVLLFVQVILFVLGIKIIYKDAVWSHVLLITLYCSYSAMILSFSLAWNSLFRSYNTSLGLFSGIGSLMCLVTGASIPLVCLPVQLIAFTRVLPTYCLPYALSAINAQDGSKILLGHSILLLYALIFFLLGSKRRY